MSANQKQGRPQKIQKCGPGKPKDALRQAKK